MKPRIVIFLSLLLSFAVYIGILYLAFGPMTQQNAVDAPTPTPAIPSVAPMTAREVETAINDYRESLGLSRLGRLDTLCHLADKRSKEIVTEFSHDKLQGGEIDIPDGYTIGENIAGDVTSTRQTIQGWINSPPHHAGMKKDWDFQCVGITPDDDGQYYVVSLFLDIF